MPSATTAAMAARASANCCGRFERNLPCLGELLLRAQAIEARALAFLLANAQKRDDAVDLADVRPRGASSLSCSASRRATSVCASARKLPQSGIAFGFRGRGRGRARSHQALPRVPKIGSGCSTWKNSVNPAPSRLYADDLDSESTVRAACSRRVDLDAQHGSRAPARRRAESARSTASRSAPARARRSGHSSAQASHAPTLLRVGIKHLAF